jgi:hypothetical protein
MSDLERTSAMPARRCPSPKPTSPCARSRPPPPPHLEPDAGTRVASAVVFAAALAGAVGDSRQREARARCPERQPSLADRRKASGRANAAPGHILPVGGEHGRGRSVPRALAAPFPRRHALRGLARGPASERLRRAVDRVNGWNLDLFVFFGDRATPAARAAAQEELNRLVVPEGPPGVLDTRPVLRPSSNACRVSALRASVHLQGRHREPARKHPCAERRHENMRAAWPPDRGAPRRQRGALEVRQTDARPLWKQLGATQPSGWPTVRMPPHSTAQVFVQLRNWCVGPVKPVLSAPTFPASASRFPHR